MDGLQRASKGTDSPLGLPLTAQVGRHAHVSGAVAVDERGALVGGSDAYAQTIQALRNVKAALEGLGATLEDVIQTWLYITDIAQWPQIGRALQEFFGEAQPAARPVEVRRLRSPELVVEIDADALLARSRAAR